MPQGVARPQRAENPKTQVWNAACTGEGRGPIVSTPRMSGDNAAGERVEQQSTDRSVEDAVADAGSAGLLRAYRFAALALAAIGVLVFWQGRHLVYYTPYGPGPSFFPFWLAGILVALALLVLAGSFRARPALSGTLLPPPGARRDIAVTLAAIVAFALLIERIGFALTVAPIIFVLLRVRGSALPTALAVAIALGFGVGYVFSNSFGVALPRAPRDLLLAIGL
jgi:hypothetical protein